MDILQKLSVKNLLLNRKRTISTMVGIILSSALICATCTLGTSFRASLVQGTIDKGGYFHLTLTDLSEEEFADLKQNRDFSRIMTSAQLGTAVLSNSVLKDGANHGSGEIQNPDKPYTTLFAMAPDTFSALKFELTEGRFPKKEDEIIISRHILTNGGLSCKVGDRLALNLGMRQTLDGQALKETDAYQETEEEIADPILRTYTIVGIIERPNYDFEPYSSPAYTTITLAGENLTGHLQSAYLTLKKPARYKQSFCELFGVSDYEALDYPDSANVKRYPNYRLNHALLRNEVLSLSDASFSELISILAVVIAVIMISSIFCIRNSFAIATTEKIHMYGMLASIGATKRQIRKNVIWEGMLIGCIAIPVGIISGLLTDVLLLKIVNKILGSELLGKTPLIWSTHWLILLLSVLLGFLTIYFSALSSAGKAAKVSPIAQLRNAQDIRISGRSLKSPKWVTALFHTGGMLAYKNLKRSKKKYRTTVVSLTVSIFTFITLNAFIESGLRQIKLHYTDYDYNLLLTKKYYPAEFSEETCRRILNLDRIQEAHILYRGDGHNLDPNDKDIILPSPYEDAEYASMKFLALDDDAFRLYAKKVGADYDTVKTSAILYNRYTYWDNSGKLYYLRQYDYRTGDTIHGTLVTATNDIPRKEEDYSVENIHVTEKSLPYGYENQYYFGGYLIMDKAYADPKISFSLENISLQSDDPDTLAAEIEKEYSSDVSVFNMDKEARNERSMLLVVSIFLYGFITVITLIGVTTIFNTITSNMELRQRDFAMLKSIGMTGREFHRMIRLETIFYSARALLYGTILGLIGNYLVYRAFSEGVMMEMYLPVVPIIISAVFVFVFVFAIMNYSMEKINRQNTIETIRNENI